MTVSERMSVQDLRDMADRREAKEAEAAREAEEYGEGGQEATTLKDFDGSTTSLRRQSDRANARAQRASAAAARTGKSTKRASTGKSGRAAKKTKEGKIIVEEPLSGDEEEAEETENVEGEEKEHAGASHYYRGRVNAFQKSSQPSAEEIAVQVAQAIMNNQQNQQQQYNQQNQQPQYNQQNQQQNNQLQNQQQQFGRNQNLGGNRAPARNTPLICWSCNQPGHPQFLCPLNGGGSSQNFSGVNMNPPQPNTLQNQFTQNFPLNNQSRQGVPLQQCPNCQDGIHWSSKCPAACRLPGCPGGHRRSDCPIGQLSQAQRIMARRTQNFAFPSPVNSAALAPNNPPAMNLASNSNASNSNSQTQIQQPPTTASTACCSNSCSTSFASWPSGAWTSIGTVGKRPGLIWASGKVSSTC